MFAVRLNFNLYPVIRCIPCRVRQRAFAASSNGVLPERRQAIPASNADPLAIEA